MSASLQELRGQGVLSPLDVRFARAMARLGSEPRPDVLLAAALASRQVARGDVCVDLSSPVAAADLEPEGEAVAWPELDGWLEQLSTSPLVAGSGEDSGGTPLVLDPRGRLYLRRLWEDEQRVARELDERSRVEPDAGEAALLRPIIERFLPGPNPEPRVAAAVACARRLCVISGRPGTGKTTTAARLLAVLVEQASARGLPAPRIALAAPTGKAAARLAEAIQRVRPEIDCTAATRAAIPTEAATLHRLLRIDRRRGPGRAPPGELAFDVVLVDEASMVDLGLAADLVAALPKHARLVLLGDPDQLASVEAGSVFADLRGSSPEHGYGDSMAAWIREASGEVVEAIPGREPALRDCVVTLTTTHRYAAQGGIEALAAAIQQGEAGLALEVLADEALPDVRLASPAAEDELRALMRRGYAAFARADSPQECLRALESFRVLCAVREGPFGVSSLNRVAEAALVAGGGLAPVPRAAAAWGAGRPLLVQRNAPHLGLYNGDVGVTDPSGSARAFFETAGGSLRSIGLARLPESEPVFAMTVHKSQGSEFDTVALVLPDANLPLLTRELVYTAVTRARREVVVYALHEVLSTAIGRRASRASGLGEALWGASR